MVGLRRRLLLAAFELLYGPLAPLHEIAGVAVAGNAWNGRRLALLDPAPAGLMLDLGCGEGRLLAAARARGYQVIGVDPSPAMLRRARSRHAVAVRATAQRLPLADASIAAVVASYPGPWIADPATWTELTRVTRPGASIRLLLGGTTTAGRCAPVRQVVTRLLYGDTADEGFLDRLPTLGIEHIAGSYQIVADRWGEAIEWCGTRIG
jgi:SAM-dependent methyltransferase